MAGYDAGSDQQTRSGTKLPSDLDKLAAWPPARKSLEISAGYDRGKLFNTALPASILADLRKSRTHARSAATHCGSATGGSQREPSSTRLIGELISDAEVAPISYP
ncbi:hypothetical protein AB0L13_00315 [Saccharopolyspora shandongensis]|uniref:hypothetical protein n=1 Tax=Saccharopolyspora shandongensis TaxID=418495 RepID=UPI003421CC6C